MFFKLIKLYLLVSEINIYQNARCNDKNLLEALWASTLGVLIVIKS